MIDVEKTSLEILLEEVGFYDARLELVDLHSNKVQRLLKSEENSKVLPNLISCTSVSGHDTIIILKSRRRADCIFRIVLNAETFPEHLIMSSRNKNVSFNNIENCIRITSVINSSLRLELVYMKKHSVAEVLCNPCESIDEAIIRFGLESSKTRKNVNSILC